MTKTGRLPEEIYSTESFRPLVANCRLGFLSLWEGYKLFYAYSVSV